MKKAIIILGLLAGTAVLATAYGRDDNKGFGRNENSTETNYEQTDERQRRNVADPEDCTLEGDEVGTGYLDNENRKHQNQSNSNRGNGRNRKN